LGCGPVAGLGTLAGGFGGGEPGPGGGALLAGVAAFVVPLRPLRVARWLRPDWLVWSMARVVKRILPG